MDKRDQLTGQGAAGEIARLQHELRTSRRMFEASFHTAVIGKAIVAVSGHCIEVNRALGDMLGCEPGSLTGVHFSQFTHPDDLAADQDLFEAVMRGERDSYQMEKRYLHRDGRTVFVLLSATVVRDESGAPIQFISEVLDITERLGVRRALQRANARLRRQVVTDHLTGLFNRRGFEEALAAPAGGAATSLLLIDLDDFKQVNDRLGHTAGDMVLAEVGRRLPRQVRDQDIVARVGGDEFGIILHDAGREVAQSAAERIVRELGSAYMVDGAPTLVGASVGVSCSESANISLRQLMAAADGALYAAKRAGRGQWRLAA